MPDRGMWNMSKRHDILAMQLSEHVRIIQKKRCSGYMGIWACATSYPDHMVPLENFGPHARMKDGLREKCKSCKKLADSVDNPKKQVWYKMAGGHKEYNRLSKESRHEIRKTARNEAIKAHLLNTERDGEVVLAHIERMKSEFGQSKPMTKRTISKVEGERVPEGWVYVVRNPDVPSILKIGKTFPDGIPDIMSSARRFGRAELVAKYEFNEAYKAEQSIHKRLERHNLRTLGYKDCGKELFQCDEMVAIFAILAEGPVLDDDEDAA